MMARKSVFGLLIAALAMGLAGCGAYSGKSYRFRMTVEVETPQGLVTGSSVYEVTAKKLLSLTSEARAGSGGTKGQALILNLPNGPVFVTLKMPVAGDHLGIRATRALLPGTRAGDIDANLAAVGELGGWFANYRAELPREHWPLMVRFGDVDMPTSAEPVDPGAIGVKRILLETTSDDVSTDIKNTLKWLGTEGPKGDVVSGSTIDPRFAETLRQSDFGSEFK